MNDYLETVMSAERIKDVAKRIGAWIFGAYVLHWFFDFEPMLAMLSILTVDLCVLSPIAFFREKNAYTAEMMDELQQTVERLIEVGGKNYDLAMSRKRSLELAESRLRVAEEKAANLERELSESKLKINELQRICGELSEKNEFLQAANASLKSEINSLKVAHDSLGEENASLKAANKSLGEENASLKAANKSLGEENESLKVANKSLTNRCNALNGILKRHKDL